MAFHLPGIDTSCSPRRRLRVISDSYLGIGGGQRRDLDVSDAGKIGGAAQKRLASGGMLHHVTMSDDIDAQRMMDVLRIGREKISDKGIASAVKRVDPLRSQTGMARRQIMDAFRRRFEQNYGARLTTLKDSELARAEELVASKFGTEQWTARVM